MKELPLESIYQVNRHDLDYIFKDRKSGIQHIPGISVWSYPIIVPNKKQQRKVIDLKISERIDA
ncbi:hypothetical protein SAMN05444412_105228 [Rhodonellum ikkaensis]|uniref:Uncharacterized protein n=1 Tax=Rhodonellum ikkaensis TaxID=336829 RepID=A0A1H3Q5I9_9BACT|nr:hypothetical protein SAMN05444412_105228 [Rhodonellum ikkaensis]